MQSKYYDTVFGTKHTDGAPFPEWVGCQVLPCVDLNDVKNNVYVYHGMGMGAFIMPKPGNINELKAFLTQAFSLPMWQFDNHNFKTIKWLGRGCYAGPYLGYQFSVNWGEWFGGKTGWKTETVWIQGYEMSSRGWPVSTGVIELDLK